MHTPRSNELSPGTPSGRGGAHRARDTRWRWIAAIALPVAVLTGAGLAMAELPADSTEQPIVDAAAVSQSPEPQTSQSPVDSGIVTQEPETPSPSPSTSDKPSEPDDTGSPVDELAEMAAQAVALTNQERTANGCGEVTSNDQLAAAATGHSKDMADNGYFDHTSQDGRSFTDRASQAGYDNAIGENIAMGYTSAEAVIEGWMNSPGHRDNLLNCDAKAIGLGVAKAADGTLLWTQMFGSV